MCFTIFILSCQNSNVVQCTFLCEMTGVRDLTLKGLPCYRKECLIIPGIVLNINLLIHKYHFGGKRNRKC